MPELETIDPHPQTPEEAAWIPPAPLVRARLVGLVDQLMPLLPLALRGLAASMARERLTSLSDHQTIELLFHIDALNSALWSAPGEEARA